MVYPAPFHRLVMIGDLYNDRWNTTLALVPTGGGGSLPAVSDELLDAVAAVCGDWFNNSLTSETGIGISQQCTLTSIKLNRIGTDGKYVDAETKEHVYSTPVAGAVNINPAPQLTIALTLRGSNERARAGRGRMYFPPSISCAAAQNDGRITAGDALSYAKGGMFLLGAIDDAYLTEGVGAVAGISSRQGTGAFQAVNHVSVGRVIDTMRSRRSAQLEEPVTWGTP